jgi:gluconolactonase
MIRSTITHDVILSGVLVMSLFALSQCTSAPASAWEEKNKELISKHNLIARTLHGLPATTTEPNLEPAQVKSLERIDSAVLYPGVNAKIFWGKRRNGRCVTAFSPCKNS